MSYIRKIKILGNVAVVLSFSFIIKMLLSMNFDTSLLNNPLLIIISILFFSLVISGGYFLAGYAWKIILQFLCKKSIDTNQVINIYIQSNIVKYLPGNIMHFAGRNILGKSMEISQLFITSSTIIEIILLIITALILVLIISFENLNLIINMIIENHDYLKILVFILTVSLLILMFLIFYFIKKDMLKKIKLTFTKDFVKILLKVMPIYIWNHMINAIIFVLIFKYILNVKVDFNLLSSACLLSWVVGYVIPGAPGGIGVREMVLIVLLSNKYNENTVVMGPVIFRIVGIASDVIAYCINLILYKNKLF